MGIVDQSQRIQRRLLLSRQPGCTGRRAVAKLETVFESESCSCTTLAKIPANRSWCAIRRVTRKLRGMAILFQEEMRLDARPAGEAPPAPRADGRTEISQATLDSLNAKLDVTYARYGDRTLEMDIYRPKGTWGELPAIVCIHGGGWANGNRANHEKVAQSARRARVCRRDDFVSLER